MKKIVVLVLALLAFSVAHAQEEKMMRVSTGSGFFINSAGYFITNNHVVQDCQSILFRGATESNEVELIATDPINDLALLLMQDRPKHTAPMRYNEGLREGDEVMIIGYPGRSINEGKYVIRTAKIIDTKGPRGEENWVQFSDSARHGNSGGPLLDGSGNVIGVVTGKMRMFDPENPMGPIKEADIAVNMPILKQFLDSNGIPYDNIISNDDFVRLRSIDTADLERNARQFITGVVCVHGPAE